MTSRAEHYQKAEAFISELEKMDDKIRQSEVTYLPPESIATINATREYLMKRAELHALLAGASVEPDEDVT